MFQRLAIPDVLVLTPKRLSDDRGFFQETFNLATMETIAGPLKWVQDNHSMSRLKGTVRGLHFQIPPFAQDKLVRCVRGSVLDVAVDIRHGSPSYGQHVSVMLTADGGEQILVPKGFAHGFVTLEGDCEVTYKVTSYYSRPHERTVRWNDPALQIDWGVSETGATLSSKDATAPMLADTPVNFSYDR